ncbi:colorectal cancer-associated protein 2 [Protobothrops mucrosquamatus]|uniref:colorectal cancer-associated protein 2 n=1 Tax=Protobothrops mucrosquamatus TaxID=103944 RepID=UPI000775CF5A|nr:colorectal cancer-associated protein 2 [Protobothrops mucrosquamatus]
MSGKAKVYQGVRVKMTVKELLQQRRAKQAMVAEAVFGECSGNVQAGEAFSPPCTVPYINTAPESSLSGGLPPWQFQNGSSCEEIPHYLEQLVDSCLQAEPLLEVPLALAQDNLACSPESFQPALTCLVLEFLGSGSPEVPDPSSTFDYSYSSSQMPPFAPLGYSCPALDGRSCMYLPPEESTCQPQNHVPHTSGLSTCYCTPCGSQHLDTFRASEFFPYATLDCKDYAPSVSMTDDFWKDRSWDLCYS